MATKTVKRAFKYRFYPTPQQEHELLRTWGCVRVVYNKALSARTQAWYNNHERVDYVDTAKMLTVWRNSEEYGFLSEVSVVPLQQSLRHLQNAFHNFWKKTARYPRFKSKRHSTLGLEYSRSGFRIKNGEIFLAKHKQPLTVAWSRPCDLDTVSTITVTRDRAHRWFISLLTETKVAGKPATGATIGVDLGVKDAVTLSTGSKHNPSDMFDAKHHIQRIKHYQRQLSKKQKGSRNREKAKLKLARAYARYTDAKRDWLHKTTSRLINEYDIIVIEDLAVANMTRRTHGKGRKAKAGLNRGLLQHNLAEFRRMLEYKTDWYGKQCVTINRFYPSSKRCHACGTINENLTLQMRTWTCRNCGTCHDRDINAAKNIEAAGLAVLACGDNIRLPS